MTPSSGPHAEQPTADAPERRSTDATGGGPAPAADGTGARPSRWDLVVCAGAVLLFAVAVAVGRALVRHTDVLRVNWPPLYADWDPHLGPGTPAAVVVALLVTGYGPYAAARLPWRRLLVSVWAASLAWTSSLALIDGWHRGVAQRLTTRYEYLQVIDRFHDVGATLRDFTHHLLINSPGNWPAHVAGHPPAATLTFVALDRIGLRGGAWAAVWVLVVGCTTAAAVLVGVAETAGRATARRAAPFLVLAPSAVWAGVSADGYFAAVAAWGVALLALSARRRSRLAALGSGLLFGLTAYLSYGLVLMGLVAAAVLLLTRTVRPLPWLLAGAALTPLGFTLAGFDWWEAYRLLERRYYQGAAGVRPYGYWVWANLACTVLMLGPAGVAGLRRVPALLPRDAGSWRRPDRRLAVLVLSAGLVLLAADLSGMSKAETERIWQPFTAWLLAATAFLPVRGRRWWLAGQASVALLVNSLLFTGW